jgi:ferritin
LLEGVFGKERKEKLLQHLNEKNTQTRLSELAKPKDKWKRLRILMDLKKKFRHDITLEKMIKEELKDNRVFKYPEEYDLYDDQEDRLCKHMIDKEMKKEDLTRGKTLREKFKTLDDKDLYYLRREVN